MEQTPRTLDDFAPQDLPRPAVLATLVKVTGSAPQAAGARMWVTAGDVRGTLGGGAFEQQILQDARALLASPAPKPLLKEYVLCRQTGQCCGGRAEVFLEPALPAKTLHLFGGGHVGRALTQVLATLPFEKVLIDPRPDWGSSQGLPGDWRCVQADPLAYVEGRGWSERDAVLVLTHSHDLDYALMRRLLSRPSAFLGLIGSEHKGEVFRARLLEREGAQGPALAAAWDDRVRCPIGRIGDKHPKAIAVTIASELLAAWSAREPSKTETAR